MPTCSCSIPWSRSDTVKPLSPTPPAVAGIKTHYLHPGGIFADAEPHLVTTVLGSCVSICLWDQVRRQGGMNHYMLPLRNGEGLASPKYGNIAIPRLIERLIQLGSAPRNLVAKVFGGASMWKTVTDQAGVGGKNVEQALRLLEEAGIRVLGRDIGGETGRKIIFNTETGIVLLRRLGSHPREMVG